MQGEKYLILNNAHQFYVILRCNRRTLEDYINYGKANMLKNDGSLDLLRLSEWLTTRGISHRAQLSEEKNPVLRIALLREITKLNRAAAKSGLFLSDEELAFLLEGVEAGQFDLCWNTAGMVRKKNA
jgi:hypothetical protein